MSVPVTVLSGISSSDVVFDGFFGLHVEQPEDFVAGENEIAGGAIAPVRHGDTDDAFDSARIGRQDYNAVGQVHGFVDVVGDKENRFMLLDGQSSGIIL